MTAEAEDPTRGIARIVADATVIVCCGTGGVGKTTAAAALALAAARRGRRVALVTIDPARRLADAMGVDELGDDVRELPPLPGIPAGSLWATMLDTKTTFDALIVRHASNQAQASRILANPYYRNLSTTLSGTREYMAMEKLFELHQDDRFDLVLVDTPPSRNALDFLDAPDRLTRFLDGRLFRLAMPGSRMMRTVSTPLIALLRRIARVVSPEVVDDTLAFIEAFSGMEEGFRERATAIDRVLRGGGTAYVLVTTPADEALEESRYLAARLSSAGLTLGAIIANRLHPRVSQASADELRAEAPPAGPLAAFYDAAIDLVTLADAEELALASLVRRFPLAPVVRVPLLDHDVHDLTGIAEIEALLLAG